MALAGHYAVHAMHYTAEGLASNSMPSNSTASNSIRTITLTLEHTLMKSLDDMFSGRQVCSPLSCQSQHRSVQHRQAGKEGIMQDLLEMPLCGTAFELLHGSLVQGHSDFSTHTITLVV